MPKIVTVSAVSLPKILRVRPVSSIATKNIKGASREMAGRAGSFNPPLDRGDHTFPYQSDGGISNIEGKFCLTC